ncbi:BZ3500_MvSof-1268-A1-R1_Chr4-4g07468 [Microbotryum saponariae]|uniref:BZ3500_MvSof-1268-A1-R1_Chr4-4g07468 protein n=1 Tax=Microbotryum saponariae TaxID=289078 RepID=A0A2X0LMD5_9BASI|nr:BZ3500_MvSof-1268-A1-R1_Chr4-4g07468 [Microbotryum saponariae]SDA07129.1 BZ3501_MvSof-1269-A2-R1_Chr4-3g07176 [Microbotryum saponariae]
MSVTATPRRSLTARLVETVRFYGPLGFVSFGGPSANLILLRKIFVIREKWIDDSTFQDLLALGNALPGNPAAVLSFLLLTGPGMFAMIGIAFGVKRIPNTLPDIAFALFTGLNSAAIGLVSLAAYQLSLKVITDDITRLLVFLMGAIAACYESQWLYPVMMAASGISTYSFDKATEYRDTRRTGRERIAGLPVVPEQAEDIEMHIARPIPAVTRDFVEAETLHKRSAVTRRDSHRESRGRYPTPPPEASSSQPSRGNTSDDAGAEVQEEERPYFTITVKQGLMICAGFFALLISLIVSRALTPRARILDFVTNLMLAGTLIFGGGPVVIPLLRSYTVDPGSSCDPIPAILGRPLGAMAIFTPGILLKLGALPLYQRFKTNGPVRSVLRGFNAGAIGLIYSAVYRLFRVGFVQGSTLDPGVPAAFRSLDQDGFWVSIVAATFVACGWFNVPTPVAILGGAVGGLAWYGVQQA